MKFDELRNYLENELPSRLGTITVSRDPSQKGRRSKYQPIAILTLFEIIVECNAA